MVPVLGRHALALQVECDDEAEFEEAPGGEGPIFMV